MDNFGGVGGGGGADGRLNTDFDMQAYSTAPQKMKQSYYQQFLQGKFINDLDEPNKPIAATPRVVKYTPPTAKLISGFND